MQKRLANESYNLEKGFIRLYIRLFVEDDWYKQTR